MKKIAKENDPKIILTLKKEFKVLCNEITLEKRNSKKDHYNHFFEKNKQKSSETWKGIRILVNINNTIEMLVCLANNCFKCTFR